MGKVLIFNGSPRAPRSNSKRYAELFRSVYEGSVAVEAILGQNGPELCAKLAVYTDVVLAFPLYVDCLPVVLLNFLKCLEEHPPANKPTVHVLINCGFIEPEQNEVCIDMVRLFCRQNGYPFGSALSIGGGEAILDTPFKFLVVWKLKALSRAILRGQPQALSVTMLLSKKAFINASTRYWLQSGQKNGIGQAQMETMDYE